MGSLFLSLFVTVIPLPEFVLEGRAEKGWRCKQRAGLRTGWSLGFCEMPGWRVTQAATRQPSVPDPWGCAPGVYLG